MYKYILFLRVQTVIHVNAVAKTAIIRFVALLASSNLPSMISGVNSLALTTPNQLPPSLLPVVPPRIQDRFVRGRFWKIGTSDTYTPAGDSNRGRQPCDVNTKAAFVTRVRGIGITQANILFAVLNILKIEHRNCEKREREVGAIVERPQSKDVGKLASLHAT